MRGRSAVANIAVFLTLQAGPVAAQEPGPKLEIVIIEGEGAINNIKQRTSRESIVEVRDENHKPVAGALVLFALPSSGPGGTFANGVTQLSVTSGADGRATLTSFHPNNIAGQFKIHVTASSQGRQGAIDISQHNIVVFHTFLHLHPWAVAAIGAAAAAGVAAGVAAAVTGGGSKTASVSVGAPRLP